MDWSYVAGFFDGEGHVGEHRFASTGGYRTHYLTMVQSMPQHQVLFEIKKFLEDHGIQCRIHTNYRQYERKRHPLTCLTVGSTDNVLKFYEGVMPYLIVKRQQASAALDRAKKRAQKARDFQGRLKKATADYIAGSGTRALGEKYGINRMRLKEHFISQGIHVRTIAEGKAISLIEQTPEFQKRRRESAILGAQMRWGGHEPKGNLKKAIIADYESGLGLVRMARKYRIAYPTLVKYFNKWGVHVRNYSEAVLAALKLRDSL